MRFSVTSVHIPFAGPAQLCGFENGWLKTKLGTIGENALRGLSYEICWLKFTDLGLNFSEAHKTSSFWYMRNHADSLCNPISFVTELPASFCTNSVPFCEQPIKGIVCLCKPIGAQFWPSTSSRPTISTSVNTTWRTACPIKDFMECAGTTPTFLTWYQYYADSK